MMSFVTALGAAGLTVAAVLCVLHILKARSFADRLVATDLLLTIIVTGFALSAVATRTTTLLPLAVVTALIGFVGTTTAARFIETRGM
ncbi:MAG TPA: monovalent cation/H+ antiporter complex subunit F [Egibacteraceae bacterium]|jgi:multicomponent Na+:H+ antiporter subunit F|nr:monovalent cation/H+ antiporter complex subunit F [Egibacteraceae bacterium]